MVERARLTPQLVLEATCPDRGERWIADTKIRGFGLRLWSTKSGGQKAFAIRVSDLASRKVRRTFDIGRASRTKLSFRFSLRQPRYGLGDYLDDAREWAQDEIDKIKGRPTIQNENWSRHREAGELVLSLTLESAAESLLIGLTTKNASQNYTDQLHKLFALHVPEKIKRTPLGALNAKQVAKALVASKASPGNARALRSFLSQIIERGASFHGPLGRFHEEFAEEFARQWERHRDVRYPELRRFRAKKYQQLFDALESDEQYWQQAMAIRLYFAFHAPLSRILSGRWKQLHESYWYPYWPDEKELWFESRDEVGEEHRRILSTIRSFGERDFGPSDHWFPSQNSRSAIHIRSVEYAWQRALRASHIRYFPLREFSRSYRDFYNPSYLSSFLQQYKEIFREVQNAAEVSKKLIAIKNHK
jgi:hypothetical protein